MFFEQRESQRSYKKRESRAILSAQSAEPTESSSLNPTAKSTNEALMNVEQITGRWEFRSPNTQKFPIVLSDLSKTGEDVQIDPPVDFFLYVCFLCRNLED